MLWMAALKRRCSVAGGPSDLCPPGLLHSVPGSSETASNHSPHPHTPRDASPDVKKEAMPPSHALCLVVAFLLHLKTLRQPSGNLLATFGQPSPASPLSPFLLSPSLHL